jgi:hypothetical protein
VNLRLTRLARPHFTPGPVDLVPRDLPRTESQQIAADVQAPSAHPAMTDGKGVHDGDTAFESNVDAGVTGPSATVYQFVRSRGRKCVAGCGRDGVIKQRGDRLDRRWCSEWQPAGELGVVDGGDGAA